VSVLLSWPSVSDRVSAEYEGLAKAAMEDPEPEEEVVAEKGDCKITISEKGIKFSAGENEMVLGKEAPADNYTNYHYSDGGNLVIHAGNSTNVGGECSIVAGSNQYDMKLDTTVFSDSANNPMLTIGKKKE